MSTEEVRSIQHNTDTQIPVMNTLKICTNTKT